MKAYNGHAGKTPAAEPQSQSRRGGEQKNPTPAGNLTWTVQSEPATLLTELHGFIISLTYYKLYRVNLCAIRTKFILANIVIIFWCSN
jgi:hypothetical protein